MIDLKGKDYKSVDGLYVMMDTFEVYDLNGNLTGKLASADFPMSREGIMDILKPVKVKPKPKPEPEPEKKGISLHALRNPKPIKKVKAKKKAKKKKR